MPRRAFVFIACLLAFLTLAQRAHAQYGYFGRNKVVYEHFEWNVLKTEHFDVYFYPEMQELAEHGAYFAEEAYKELENRFNYSLNRRVPLIFYSSNIHFKQTNTTPGFIPDGVGGFFEFLKGRVVIPANGDIHRFRRVVRHELVHVFTHAKVSRVMRDHRIASDRFLPLWFTEGLAEYWSGERDYQHDMIMRDALFSNYLVPLESMDRIAGTYLMYKQGEAICRFISETYGEDKILDLIDNFWKDRDFRRVMEVSLREDFRETGDRWQGWLRETYFPALRGMEVASYMAKGVATRGFSSKPAYYQFRDGRRKVYYMGNRGDYSNVYEVDVDSNLAPVGKPRPLIRGERNNRFEAFHLFESRVSASRSGKLAFVTKSGAADVIHVYNLERDRLEATYSFEGLIAIYSPDWSPDGKQLVFSSIARDGFADLYTYDTESGRLSRLTDDKYDDRDPSWSPDGRQIAFSSDRTSEGKDDAYNLFTYELQDGKINYVTYGDRHDFSPRWSPDGEHLVFISTMKDTTGRYTPQNVWAAYMDPAPPATPVVAAASYDAGTPLLPAQRQRRLKQLTDVTGAAFDPIWTEDGALLFANFEHYRFTIRSMPDIDSLMAAPEREQRISFEDAGAHWAFAQIGVDEGARRERYKRRYNLDIAQGALNQNPVWGTTGGAVLAFSDMLGDDYWYVSLYNTANTQSDFLRSLSMSLTRVQLHRRTSTSYGVYRYGGLRYDITDPDAATEYPIFWETMYGGFGAVSYPLSMFRRVEVSTSLNWSDKEVNILEFSRKALLLSNAVSLVHDNSLFGANGPMKGWRTSLTGAYTTDVLYSNVNYFTLSADARRYWNLGRGVSVASWALGRMNQGREARLFVLGGSWDLRGYNLFSVRGKKMWFTSHELRFPIVNAPSVFLPILAPFGIANLRGALFADAAHVWNRGYYDRDRLPLVNGDLTTGQTIGSSGIGFRMNLFGGFVLRYDIGYQFSEGFRERSNRPFKQFFFGWDF